MFASTGRMRIFRCVCENMASNCSLIARMWTSLYRTKDSIRTFADKEGFPGCRQFVELTGWEVCCAEKCPVIFAGHIAVTSQFCRFLRRNQGITNA